jgi:hypothetical protein
VTAFRSSGLAKAVILARAFPLTRPVAGMPLIVSAGAVFGAMLKIARVGGGVEKFADSFRLSLILLAYFMALIIRLALGSARGVMLTTSAMAHPTSGPEMACQPLYLFLAIGFASLGLSWMNGGRFWVVFRLSGMTEKEERKVMIRLAHAGVREWTGGDVTRIIDTSVDLAVIFLPCTCSNDF